MSANASLLTPRGSDLFSLRICGKVEAEENFNNFLPLHQRTTCIIIVVDFHVVREIRPTN